MRRTLSNVLLHWMPFVLMFVAFGVGLYVEGENRSRDDAERKERVEADQRIQDAAIRADCERQEQTVMALDQLIRHALADQPPIAIPADADPAVRRILESVNASRSPAATAARRAALLALLPETDNCAG